MQARKMIVAVGMAVVLFVAAGAMAVNIETVPVGDIGNAPDMRTQVDNTSGYGAVAYSYNIGKYEVTAGQYTAFLNAVGGVDTYSLYNPTMSRTDYGSGYNAERRRYRRQSLCLLGGDKLRQPPGELCELLGLLPIHQLAQ